MHVKLIYSAYYGECTSVYDVYTCAQSWRYKPGQYIAGASGCGPPALPYKGLDNGPSSSSAPLLLSIVTGRREQHQDSRGPQDARLLVRRLSSADLLHRRPQRLAQRTKRAHALRQAQSSCQLTGRRVRPGVTAATPLPLAAASHWLAGPSLGLRHRQCRCHYRARPRERQALIRECLGQF